MAVSPSSENSSMIVIKRRTDVDLKVHSSEDCAESPVFVRTDARKRERVVVDEFAREIDEFVFLDNGVLSGHW
jgi:hypothetical protein